MKLPTRGISVVSPRAQPNRPTLSQRRTPRPRHPRHITVRYIQLHRHVPAREHERTHMCDRLLFCVVSYFLFTSFFFSFLFLTTSLLQIRAAGWPPPPSLPCFCRESIVLPSWDGSYKLIWQGRDDWGSFGMYASGVEIAWVGCFLRWMR